jgi:hypothetical protein
MNFEFLFYLLVAYMSFLYAHGPLCSKACFDEIFCKGKGGGFNCNFRKKKKSLDDNRKLKL